MEVDKYVCKNKRVCVIHTTVSEHADAVLGANFEDF
jgi:hypothetical protein